MRNYFPADDCLLKIKVHHCYGAETYVYKSECETLVTHSSAPSGCFQVCKDSSPRFTMKTLLVVSLIHCVALIIQGAAGEVLPFFNSRNRIFSLSLPVEWSLVFVCSLASKLWLFLKKKNLLPSLMFKWPGPLLPQFLQLTLNHRRPKQHQNQVSPTVILLNNAINHIYLDFWDIFA